MFRTPLSFEAVLYLSSQGIPLIVKCNQKWYANPSLKQAFLIGLQMEYPTQWRATHLF